MDRMGFIPGPQAKTEIHEAEGRIYFNRAAALDYSDEFLVNCPGGGLARSPHLRFLLQVVGACLSEGDLVDVYFGMREVGAGEREDPGGELIGHTWAVLTHADGRKETVWEVGRDTPFAGEAYAQRAFNGYRQAMGRATNTWIEPIQFKAEEENNKDNGESTAQGEQGGDGEQANDEAAWPTRFRDKAVMSRALAPANLYLASARMWYFVDFAPPGQLDEEPVLSRPLRAFDALILSTLVALAYGSPPQVFGVRYKLENIGKVPTGYLRTQFEESATLRDQTDEEIILVM